jgi:hypothetical protein
VGVVVLPVGVGDGPTSEPEAHPSGQPTAAIASRPSVVAASRSVFMVIPRSRLVSAKIDFPTFIFAAFGS